LVKRSGSVSKLIWHRTRRTRLCLCDAAEAQCAGSPGPARQTGTGSRDQSNTKQKMLEQSLNECVWF